MDYTSEDYSLAYRKDYNFLMKGNVYGKKEKKKSN